MEIGLCSRRNKVSWFLESKVVVICTWVKTGCRRLSGRKWISSTKGTSVVGTGCSDVGRRGHFV